VPEYLSIDDDLRGFRAFVAAREWTFAKSMPEHPHEYTVRLRDRADEDFREAVRVVRRRGRTVYFKGRPYTCLDAGRWRYWTMGAPVLETTIINRART
jgi:hypothetical protein